MWPFSCILLRQGGSRQRQMRTLEPRSSVSLICGYSHQCWHLVCADSRARKWGRAHGLNMPSPCSLCTYADTYSMTKATVNQQKEKPHEDFHILLENPPSAAGNVLEFSVVSLTVPGPVGQGFGETAGLGLWAQYSMLTQLLGELLSLSVPPLFYLYREVMLMHLPPKHTFNKHCVWKNPHKKQIPPKPWLCQHSHLSVRSKEKRLENTSE